jgi:hypothetical protein
MLYQWYFNDAPLAGATGSSLTVTNVQLAHDGDYSVSVSDEYGMTPSQPARLIVLVDPLILERPIGASVPQGVTVTLSVAVTNTATLPVSYRWRKNSATLTNLVLHAYASFLTITNVQGSNNYSVQVTNLARVMTVTPNVAVIALADADRDGLPDAWEIANGFNTNDAADALLDTDGDTMLNWQEYAAGTEHTNALSYLKVQTLEAGAGETTLEFYAISNRTYSVLFQDALRSETWSRLADIPARPTNRIERVRDPSPAAPTRYYRLATPALQP